MGIGSAIVIGIFILLAAAIVVGDVSFITLVNMGLSLIIWAVIIIGMIMAIVIGIYAGLYVKQHIKWRR
jgi:hypothetical protein